MAGTILGKRSRSALSSAETIKSCKKRRTPFVIASDENAPNPFIKQDAPPTPKSPSTPRQTTTSVYNAARNVLRNTNGKLIARESEKDELRKFITSRIDSHTSGCLYISGPPGTGKSALVSEVCEELEENDNFTKSYVNCVSVKNAAGVYGKLLEDFDQHQVLQGNETQALQSLFNAQEIAHLVILDETDHLFDVDLELLYNLFQWSLRKDSNLILIGIANALDFTDRFLPRLKSKGLKPQLLPFMPYSAAQLNTIITTKLKSLLPEQSSAATDFVPVIHPTAIMFAAKKVAAQTGDLRKAFSICARAIDLIETESLAKLAAANSQITPSPSPSPTKTPLMENVNLCSPVKVRSPQKVSLLKMSPTKVSPMNLSPVKPVSAQQNWTLETAPRATIAHMARVTSAAFSNGVTQRLQTLNLQQKAALCVLISLERRSRRKMANSLDMNGNPMTPSKREKSLPTVKALFEAYTSLCKRDNILHPLTSTEFRDIVSGLETLGLASWAEGRNGSFTPSRTPSRTPTRTPSGLGTPSRRGRKGAFGGPATEERMLVSSIGEKELRESLTGVGSDILVGLLDVDDEF